MDTTGNNRRRWTWIIGLVVVALLIFAVIVMLAREPVNPPVGRAVGIPVVAPDPVVPVDPLSPGDPTAVMAADPAPDRDAQGQLQQLPVAAIAIAPEPFLGRQVSGVGHVVDPGDSVPSDASGFWLEQEGRRIFALVARPTANGTVTVEPGQSVRVSGVVHPGSMAAQVVAGLDAQTQGMLAEHRAFVFVDADGLEIVGD